jgi:hypothetical protein
MTEEKKDFEVKDRRIFSQDGEVKASTDQASPDSSPPDENKTAAATEEAGGSDTSEASKADKAEESPPMPEINFATFVVSLNASALLHLGAIEDPNTGQTDKNLPMAKQTIDILSMLEEKTAGNLTKDEENLLKNILYDLRIIYVKEKG